MTVFRLSRFNTVLFPAFGLSVTIAITKITVELLPGFDLLGYSVLVIPEVGAELLVLRFKVDILECQIWFVEQWNTNVIGERSEQESDEYGIGLGLGF